MLGRFISILCLVGFSINAQANCFSKIEGKFKRFVCSDGTVQKITIQNEQVIVMTYSPESKRWSEVRFPAPYGATLDTLNVSFQQ